MTTYDDRPLLPAEPRLALDQPKVTRVLRMVPCAMDGCRCGLPHPAYGDCDHCRGRGFVTGGDESQPCLHCRDHFRREYPRP